MERVVGRDGHDSSTTVHCQKMNSKWPKPKNVALGNQCETFVLPTGQKLGHAKMTLRFFSRREGAPYPRLEGPRAPRSSRFLPHRNACVSRPGIASSDTD